MTTSCPYCGAALNLNFCVVCGRQGSSATNKIGNLQNVARNSDVTQRFENPLETEKLRKEQKALRLKKLFRFILECTVGGLIVAALFFIGVQQIINYQIVNKMNQVMPWLQTLHLKFPNWAAVNTSAENIHPVKTKNARQNKNKHHH